MHIFTYKCVFLRTITDKLRINSILIERIDTLRKISNGYLYDSDTLCFFCFFFREHIYSSRMTQGPLRTCLRLPASLMVIV